MAKIKVLIVEDDFIHANKLAMYLDEMGYEVCGSTKSSNEALNLVAAIKPDLILMDIHIEGERDGVEIAEIINEKNKIPLIFITSYRDKETFERAKLTNPYAYILKPFEKETLQMTIELSVHKILQVDTNFNGWEDDQLIEDAIFVKTEGRLVKVAVAAVDYIEVKDKYCLIYSSQEIIKVRISLNNLLEKLNNRIFVRVHRSFIANIKMISEVLLSQNIVKIGMGKIPIGRQYKEALMAALEN